MSDQSEGLESLSSEDTSSAPRVDQTRHARVINLGAVILRCVAACLVARQVSGLAYRHAWYGRVYPWSAVGHEESLAEAIALGMFLSHGVWGWTIPAFLGAACAVIPGRVTGARIWQRGAVFMAVALVTKFFLMLCAPR